MAACLLVPTLFQFFATGRSRIHATIELLYPKQFYLDLPNGLIAPVYGSPYWTVTAFLPLVVIITAAVLVRMFQKDRSALIDFIGLVVLSAMMIFPIVGSISNGMSYPINRWLFGFDLSWIIHLGIWDMKSHLAGLKATFGALRILTEQRSW